MVNLSVIYHIMGDHLYANHANHVISVTHDFSVIRVISVTHDFSVIRVISVTHDFSVTHDYSALLYQFQQLLESLLLLQSYNVNLQVHWNDLLVHYNLLV